MMRFAKILATMAATGLLALPAAASELRYTPTNPTFGGSPFNSAHLLGRASAQNDHERPSNLSDSFDNLDDTVTRYVLSSVSSQISGAIFRANPANPADSISLSNGTRLEYQQNLATNTVTLVIYRPDGQITRLDDVPLSQN